MTNQSTLNQAKRIIAILDKEEGIKKISLKPEEFRLIRNLLRLEYIKFQEDYDRYSNVHTLSILTFIENVRRKFKLDQ